MQNFVCKDILFFSKIPIFAKLIITPEPMKISISSAHPEDVREIAGLQIDMALESEGLNLDAQTLEAGVKRLIDEPDKGRYFLAYDADDTSGKIIGCLMVTKEWSDWNNSEYWWLQSVYVLPEYRRKGVFTRMAMYVENEARMNGVKTLKLYVDAENDPAQKCYDSLGLMSSHYLIREKDLR